MKKDCLTTFSKVDFNTFEPEEDKIRIEDIAHALSMMTRANGHFPQFFSVGQHCTQCCHEATASAVPSSSFIKSASFLRR